MRAVYENLDEVHRHILEAVGGFSFADGDIADKLVNSVVEGIQGRSEEAQMGATDIWPENSDNPPGEGYKSWKSEHYGTDKTNYRTKQMLSRESLTGQVTVTPKCIEIRYGQGIAPVSSDSGYLNRTDTDSTDIEKAFWAATQGRGFFELDDAIKDSNFIIFTDAFGVHLQSA